MNKINRQRKLNSDNHCSVLLFMRWFLALVNGFRVFIAFLVFFLWDKETEVGRTTIYHLDLLHLLYTANFNLDLTCHRTHSTRRACCDSRLFEISNLCGTVEFLGTLGSWRLSMESGGEEPEWSQKSVLYYRNLCDYCSAAKLLYLNMFQSSQPSWCIMIERLTRQSKFVILWFTNGLFFMQWLNIASSCVSSWWQL